MAKGNPGGPLAIVLADPVLCAALVEVCRTGRCRTRGRKITYRVTQIEPGRLKVDEKIAAKHEPIPPDDWAGRDLLEWPKGVRLEGAVEYAGIPEGHFVHKGWADVTFDTHILRALVEGARQPPKAAVAAQDASAATTPAPAAPPELTRRRRVDTEREAKLVNGIKSVVAAAKHKWPDPTKRPPASKMAEELVKPPHRFGFREGTLRQILLNTYRPMKSRKIAPLSG